MSFVLHGIGVSGKEMVDRSRAVEGQDLLDEHAVVQSRRGGVHLIGGLLEWALRALAA